MNSKSDLTNTVSRLRVMPFPLDGQRELQANRTFDSQCPVSPLCARQVTTLSNFNFCHTFYTFGLAGNRARITIGSYLLFHTWEVSTQRQSFNLVFYADIDTSLAMLACCNWQHIYFCQIEGAGSIPVADTVVSSSLD